MTFLSKILLGLTSLTGSCCAVAVPVSMFSQGRPSSKTIGESSPQQTLLGKCSDTNTLSEHSLKDITASSSCGKVESNPLIDNENEGNTIWNSLGGEKNSGVDLVANSQTYCRNEDGDSDAEGESDNRGSLWKEDDKSRSCSRTQYLELENKKGVKHEVKKDGQNSNITKLCLNDCGIFPPQSIEGSRIAVTSSVKEKESSGHLVKFYKKVN